MAPPLKWAGTQILHGVTALRNGNPKSMGHGLTLTNESMKLGMPSSPHVARATAATNALDNGADIAKVQEWLGHEISPRLACTTEGRARPGGFTDFRSQLLISRLQVEEHASAPRLQPPYRSIDALNQAKVNAVAVHAVMQGVSTLSDDGCIPVSL